MPLLIQKRPDGSAIKQWFLQDKPLTVGRGDQAEAKIDDNEMSRQHFVISPKSGGYVIQDQNSRNGTLVNGRRVSETILNLNDTILAGQSRFVFVRGEVTIMEMNQHNPNAYADYVREISKEAKP